MKYNLINLQGFTTSVFPYLGLILAVFINKIFDTYAYTFRLFVASSIAGTLFFATKSLRRAKEQ